MTPLTASSSYCSASRLFAFHDWRTAADAVVDSDTTPRPTKASLVDSGSQYGAIIAATLLSASGEVEAACLVGKRYQPTDLQSLTGSGLAFLEKLVADLAFWHLCQRRQPIAANPDNVPGARSAVDMLERLRIGERIFAFDEAAAAGLPSVVEPAAANTWQGERQTVRQAQRFFGTRGRDRDC